MILTNTILGDILSSMIPFWLGGQILDLEFFTSNPDYLVFLLHDQAQFFDICSKMGE